MKHKYFGNECGNTITDEYFETLENQLRVVGIKLRNANGEVRPRKEIVLELEIKIKAIKSCPYTDIDGIPIVVPNKADKSFHSSKYIKRGLTYKNKTDTTTYIDKRTSN